MYYGGRKKKEQTHLLCSSKRSIYHFLREMKEAEKEKKKDTLAVLKAINHFQKEETKNSEQTDAL